MITFLHDDIGASLSGQRITQLLRLFVVFHQFFHLRHVRSDFLHLALQLLQMLADDVHAEIQNQVFDTLAQQIAIAIYLKATAQLMAVYT